MKKIIKITLVSIGLVALYIAWYLISPAFINIRLEEDIPEGFTLENTSTLIEAENMNGIETETMVPVISHANNFQRVDYDVQGSYSIIDNGNEKLLRIENLDIANGPDLHFVFSNTNQAWNNNSYESIAALPGNQGSYNILIPDGLNPDDYKYLLIHCVQFSHTFASADIS